MYHEKQTPPSTPVQEHIFFPKNKAWEYFGGPSSSWGKLNAGIKPMVALSSGMAFSEKMSSIQGRAQGGDEEIP